MEERNNSLLRKCLIEAQMKKTRIVSKPNYFSYVTNNLILDGDYIEFTDIKGTQIVMALSSIAYLEIYSDKQQIFLQSPI